MSHHPERTARNVRPVNQPPSFCKYRPDQAVPVKVIEAWLESTGRYTYPPEETDEFELFGITYDPKGSPFGTPAALMKIWEPDDDVLERHNISYIEMPL